jgi:hypothetical protein
MEAPLNERIVSLLCLRGEWMYPKQIARELHEKDNSSVRGTLRRLHRQRRVHWKDHLYAATETIRKEWFERLAYGAEEVSTRYHGLCYTLTIADAYRKAEEWETVGLGERQLAIEHRHRGTTIRVFQNNKVIIYIRATERPLNTEEIADMDQYIDGILQAKFNASLKGYEIRTFEANNDVINATLTPSIIEVKQEDRIIRLYEKALEGVPCMRMEQRRYAKPLTITGKDAQPIVTLAILDERLRGMEETIGHMEERQKLHGLYMKDLPDKIYRKNHRESGQVR